MTTNCRLIPVPGSEVLGPGYETSGDVCGYVHRNLKPLHLLIEPSYIFYFRILDKDCMTNLSEDDRRYLVICLIVITSGVCNLFLKILQETKFSSILFFSEIWMSQTRRSRSLIPFIA